MRTRSDTTNRYDEWKTHAPDEYAPYDAYVQCDACGEHILAEEAVVEEMDVLCEECAYEEE